VPLLPCYLSLACFPGTASGATALSSTHSPQPGTSGGGGGRVTALADGGLLLTLVTATAPTPSPFSTVLTGTPPGSWPEPPGPLGQQINCFPLAGIGSLSSLITRTLCGCGIFPKATSESRQEKQRSQGRLTEKEFEFFFFLWMF
jgi:hypothetical protein